MIINEATGVLEKELGANEKLLWTGVPRKGFALRKSDATLIPFSLIWAGGAIYFEYQALRTSNELFDKLWGIPFVIMGFYLVFGRFLVDTWQREKTYYGVTNERIIIMMNWFGKKIRSLELKHLQDMTVDEQADGSGTIYFGQVSEQTKEKEAHKSFHLSPPPQTKRPSDSERAYPAFEMIPQVKSVYNLIRKAQQRA